MLFFNPQLRKNYVRFLAACATQVAPHVDIIIGQLRISIASRKWLIYLFGTQNILDGFKIKTYAFLVTINDYLVIICRICFTVFWIIFSPIIS